MVCWCSLHYDRSTHRRMNKNQAHMTHKLTTEEIRMLAKVERQMDPHTHNI